MIEAREIEKFFLYLQGMKRNRNKYNKEILNIMIDIIDRFPDIRFCQLLCGLGLPYQDVDCNGGVKDRFYEESQDTLAGIKKWAEQYNLKNET